MADDMKKIGFIPGVKSISTAEYLDNIMSEQFLFVFFRIGSNFACISMAGVNTLSNFTEYILLILVGVACLTTN